MNFINLLDSFRGVVRIGIPRRLVFVVSLVAPTYPFLASAASEQLKIRVSAAPFNKVVLFIWLSGMFALACCQEIYLRSRWRERASVLSADAK